uniref:4Fe-4S ferredoxin-type domain-containing protein n=1 Tax=Salix viminalis TaxID=40686 RepID=A0A6N2KJB4_SALVM
MKQLGNIAVIAILVISIVSKLTAGNSTLEGVQSNLTTASSTSISPWLKKAMNHHPRPRPPGCRSTPWICREGLHPPPARMRCCRHQCADVSSDVSNCGFCGKRCPFFGNVAAGVQHRSRLIVQMRNRCHDRCAYGCGYALPFPIRRILFNS